MSMSGAQGPAVVSPLVSVVSSLCLLCNITARSLSSSISIHRGLLQTAASLPVNPCFISRQITHSAKSRLLDMQVRALDIAPVKWPQLPKFNTNNKGLLILPRCIGLCSLSPWLRDIARFMWKGSLSITVDRPDLCDWLNEFVTPW